MSLFRATLFIVLLATPVLPTVIDDVQVRSGLPGARFPDPRPTADRRGQARGRRLLVARRQAARLPERARAGQPLLPDLRRSIWRPATRSASRPGIGKTTCAFFRPGTDEIEFASTHADPKSKQYQDEELAFRASGKERRYSWDYDPEMDIYAYNEKTGALKRLTTARGYDAEGSYSPDGQWIVVLVDARRLQPHADRRRSRSSSRRTRATSPRSTSCAPTAPARSG